MPFALNSYHTMPNVRTQISSNRSGLIREKPPSKPNTRKRGDSGAIGANKKLKMDDDGNNLGEEPAAPKKRAKGKGRRQKTR